MSSLTVKYNHGNEDCKTAFVFSCPGQKEELANMVTAGRTGTHLDILISLIRQNADTETLSIFPYEGRYSYRITNASDKIHYPSFDGKSQPDNSEILDEANLERLASELNGIKYILFFGEKAGIALKKLRENNSINNDVVTFRVSRHLSFLSLNRMTKDKNGNLILKGTTPEERKANTEKRIDVIADEIIKIIKENAPIEE